MADCERQRVGGVDGHARALASEKRQHHRPDLLLLEHPTATLGVGDVDGFAADLRRIAARRALTMVAVTADAAFASAMTPDVLRLQPASGDLVPQTGAWGRVKRLFGA